MNLTTLELGLVLIALAILGVLIITASITVARRRAAEDRRLGIHRV